MEYTPMIEDLNYVLVETITGSLVIVPKADGSGELCVFTDKVEAKAALSTSCHAGLVLPFQSGKLESVIAAIRLYNGLVEALPDLTEEQRGAIIDKRLNELLQRN